MDVGGGGAALGGVTASTFVTGEGSSLEGAGRTSGTGTGTGATVGGLSAGFVGESVRKPFTGGKSPR